MDVHAAIKRKEITSVKCKVCSLMERRWTQYVYAAINITKRGEWPKNVVRYASTR